MESSPQNLVGKGCDDVFSNRLLKTGGPFLHWHIIMVNHHTG
jgi:hypothetical protein